MPGLQDFRTGDTPQPDIVILTHKLARDYDMGGEVVRALRGVSLQIRKNEYVAVMGPSGSGKSTFMNLIGCLDTPTAGEYWLNGQKVSDLSDDELARIRNKEIGLGLQTFHLLPRLAPRGPDDRHGHARARHCGSRCPRRDAARRRDRHGPAAGRLGCPSSRRCGSRSR